MCHYVFNNNINKIIYELLNHWFAQCITFFTYHSAVNLVNLLFIDCARKHVLLSVTNGTGEKESNLSPRKRKDAKQAN